MKNKYVRAVVTILLGLFVSNFGNMIGGVLGDLIATLGAVAVIYAIVEVFKKQKSLPPATGGGV